MGTRNAAVRTLAIPDLTTTVLTLTITGIGADSWLANGNNPRLARRVAAVAPPLFGAVVGGGVLYYFIFTALLLSSSMFCVVRLDVFSFLPLSIVCRQRELTI